MPASKAQQKAVAKYMTKNYDEIKMRVPKGGKALVQAAADQAKESVNEYANKAILARMGHEKWPEVQSNKQSDQ